MRLGKREPSKCIVAGQGQTIPLKTPHTKRQRHLALKLLSLHPDRKTKRIKEHTVLAARGLRPEIQRLLTRHTAEIADLEAEKERRLSYQERELNQQHLEHIRELRAKWEEENVEEWSNERQNLSQRQKDISRGVQVSSCHRSFWKI